MINTKQLLLDAINHYENDEMQLAISQFNRLTKSNNEEAYLYLSLIYKDGDGVDQDELKAKRCKKKYVEIIFEKANQGDVQNKLKYAYILQYGDGIQKDESKALDLFKELAKNNVAEAQFHLYSIYQHGFCLQSSDLNTASYWLDKAFNSNWPEAIYIKALQILSTNEDSLEALTLLKNASNLGFFPATELLTESKVLDSIDN